jgi:hypothetical protein
MARRRSTTPKIVVSRGKFVKVLFAPQGKKQEVSRVGKVVERDLTWSWLQVGNSSFLNGDVRITWW